MTKYTRRLQKIGSTTMVSLPKEWVDANGLAKNDEVQIEPGENMLVIAANNQSRPIRDVTISYPLPENENISANVTGAYLLGYGMIHIKSAESIPIRDRQNIRDSVRRLAGMEIMEEDASSITAQFLLDPAILNPQKTLKRMSKIVLGMFGDLLNSLISGDQSNLQTLHSRDLEVNRQYFLSVRLIRNAIADKNLADAFNLENVDVVDYRIAANILEGTGDTIVELADELPNTSVSKDDLAKIYEIAKGWPQMGETAVDSFVDNDRRRAISAIESHKKNQAAVASLRNSLSGHGRVQIDFLDILYMFDRVERSWADIADLVKPVYGSPG